MVERRDIFYYRVQNTSQSVPFYQDNFQTEMYVISTKCKPLINSEVYSLLQICHACMNTDSEIS